MKKLASLFSDSFQEFRNIRTITTTAMFTAISIVLGYFTLVLGPYVKIGFSTISNQFVYYMFGPSVGACFGAMLDILKYLLKPTGPYFPGFTLGAAIGGLIYGCIFYKHSITLKRVLAAELLVSIICNMLLGTYWLTLLYGKGFLAILPMRIFKNLIMWPINSILFYSIGKALDAAGIFKMLKQSQKNNRIMKKQA